MMTKRIFAAVVSLCMLGSIAACTPKPADAGSGTSPEGTAAQPGDDLLSVVRFGRDWPLYYDPAVGSNYISAAAITNIYSPLVFSNIDGTVSPHVAESWEVSEDGLAYTFKIRDDITFHSGNKLTAEDVAFSMNRMLTIGEGFSSLYDGVIQSAEATGDDTVVFHLTKTYGPLLNTLIRFFVVEKAVVMDNLDMSTKLYGEFGDYGKGFLLVNDAGSGPYKTKELKLEEYLLGEQFPQYFLGWGENAPQYFRLENVHDPVAQKTAFANQTLEITVDSLPMETYAEIEKMNEGAEYLHIPGAGGWNLTLNTKVAPTDDIHFRKALAHAFDYESVLDNILIVDSRATGPVASAMFGKNTDLPGYTFDLEKAKEELALSKYADQPEMWNLTMNWTAEVAEQEKIALMFQSALQQLGISIEVTKTPFSVITANAQTIETTPNCAIVKWTPSYFEAGDVFRSRYHSSATGSWEQLEWVMDDKLDAMIEESISIIDASERAKKYAEIEQYIYDLCPTIWISTPGKPHVVQPYVNWYVNDRYKENIPQLYPNGYDIFFHDMEIFVDQRTR